MEINKARRSIEETFTTLQKIKSFSDPKDLSTFLNETDYTQTQTTQ
jgi:hypothetical protein